MPAHRMLIGLAVLALGVGVLASVANAAPPCGSTACGDEIAASGLSGKSRAACLRQVMSECREGLCSCTGGSPPCSCVCGDGLCGPAEDCSTCPADCGSCPPTNTTTTTSSCPTTTAPLTCIGSFSGACGTAPCPPGQTCIEGSSGSCECVGPPPPCDGLTEPFCGSGVCPPGMQCVSLYEPPACSTACECR